jgi:hypothetical protein
MELNVNLKRPQDMKDSVRPVLQITITERNLASWSKPIRQRFEEGVLEKGDVNNTTTFHFWVGLGREYY